MMSNKTLEINSIPIPPQLAGRLKQALGKSGTGFDEGAFLQQLYYWTLNPATTGWMIDGTKWIYNSLKSWQEQFPWMSEYGLRKAIANLKKLGLIETAQHWISCCKRVMFYRIDYERLNTFTEDFCDLVAPRFVNSDHIDARSGRIANTETSPETSFSEQQTDVVSDMNENLEDMDFLKTQSCNQASEVEAGTLGGDNLSRASSGNDFAIQDAEFPELIDAVAQAVAHPAGSPLPTALKRAIAQFPDRVQAAIDYLNHQQQKQQIKNPVGYLYQAIVKNWKLQIEKNSILPKGFNEWFDQMKRQGLVVAAMVIDGIHYTLHSQLGWITTTQLIQQYPL
ncbi:hypothetical protein JOY44_26050 (plasmid) [Phormidium sp. CLA17]|uniref:hypothetical protein n=1 Tax=Leptolyngbya sp. Cla-17 TaxID=2803751 RepID=UPI0014917EE6|nr:hypothetical protein [Leptolyngbya sp. Cla-17]MBM0744985.1 hypothetical protein [Leptolyngbya sp. Cla-17]